MSVTSGAILAVAGGGSSGFGGGGGGGFSGGGGTGSGGSGPWWLWALFVLGFVLLVFVAYVAERRRRRRRRQRVERVITAAAEAVQDDTWFAPDTVTAEATALFRRAQAAWDARDRKELATIIGADLMIEWSRRLDDFEGKGWHNRVEVLSGPAVQYVGLVNREDDSEDRVVVRLEAGVKDWVVDAEGAVIKRNNAASTHVAIAEYWTLARRDDGWRLVSIEQDAEGHHHLEAPIVASPWSDTAGLRDEALVEGAEAATGSPADYADVDYADDAHTAALDLSLLDGRFAPAVIEASVRRALGAWAQAVDGDDASLAAIADGAAIADLLHPGDPDRRTRLVVRGPRVDGVEVVELDADAQTITVEARLRGRRYVEDRDTLALVRGTRDREVEWTERWTLALSGDEKTPWRITAATTPQPA